MKIKIDRILNTSKFLKISSKIFFKMLIKINERMLKIIKKKIISFDKLTFFLTFIIKNNMLRLLLI